MNGKPVRRFWRSTAATASIEFAFLSIPFFALCLGVVEFGRACWTLEALQESAAQGARCVAVQSSSCYSGGSYSASTTESYIQNVASGWGIAVPTADITPTQSTTCAGVSGFAQIQISYTYSTVVGALIPSLKNEPMTVTSCFPNDS
jgi:Flp pilus assembly protein TadG